MRARGAAGGLALAALAALPGTALAQRKPVLKQIRVPHSYYYREMYLPQVTSGPSSVAWSPDGSELVVSMQGSLWRIEPGSGVARQVTSGPGYEHQPDWSPDGRFIAYSSYRDDAVELWMLEAATGRTWPLTQGGAVNVEPRFSPDGRRLAFVSTAFEGRFHVFTLALADGQAGPALRITADRESGLPRYYYSRFDHYLSPTWSPDGSEVLFVSNRGRIWGTGGFWRMEATPGASPREVRYEETTWKARPDWSRDSRRVVYSSYLGGQWHQLWLMTAEGGDVIPLTYGDHDATAPRWCPDSRRIAYVSNEGGNTSLWIIELPGGRRSKVEIRERRFLGPVGRLRIEVVDPDGRLASARVSVTGADGRGFAPDDAWRHADDAFDRGERRFEYTYFHTRGESELTVPAGAIAVEVTRGLEHRPARREVAVEAGSVRTVRLALERLADLPARGFWGGDLHVHMNYGGAYRADPATLAFQAAAEDVHVAWNLIVNKEQRIPDVDSFRPGPDPVSTPERLILHGQEFHTSLWGHLGLLGLSDHLLVPAYAAYVNTAAASLHPANATIADLARAQGALVGYVHPFDTEPDPTDVKTPLTNELPADVALGKVDYYEVVGFSDHRATERVWHRLLNCGFRIPAGAGTDAMTNFASLRGPVGLNRVYVKSGPQLDLARWSEALKAGRTFATNGPLLDFALRPARGGGAWREPGDELVLPRGQHRLEARVSLRSIVPVDRLEVVGDGRVVGAVTLTGDRTAADAIIMLAADRSGWYTLRAYAGGSRHPILDIYPFGTTSPIYVTVDEAPVRSGTDAAYFLAWMDRLLDAARGHEGWNGAEERSNVLGMLAEARAVWADRASPPPRRR